MTNIILDTHILLWLLLTPTKLSKETIDTITEAQNNNKLFISSISLWEISMLINKKRIYVFEPVISFLNTISNIDGLTIMQINASIGADSGCLLDFHGDPADRLIVATTRELAGSLITKDQKILEWAEQGFIRTIRA
jgi:PIN domain nuclease of toxin-antitoxin system